MGVRATGAERGRQKTSVAYTDRILSRAGVRARRERSPILCSGGAPANVARALLLRNLAGTRSRPSVGAVTQTSDRHTRHSVASVPVKVARAAIEAPASTGTRKIARHRARGVNVLLRGLLFHVCNMPYASRTSHHLARITTCGPSWIQGYSAALYRVTNDLRRVHTARAVRLREDARAPHVIE